MAAFKKEMRVADYIRYFSEAVLDVFDLVLSVEVVLEREKFLLAGVV